MKIQGKPLEGRLIKRYKRFFADIQLNGADGHITAHVPNSGSMLECSEPGSRCLVSQNSNPARKLQYTLEMVESQSNWVGVNTMRPNHLIREYFEKKIHPPWRDFDFIQSEVKVSVASRLDFAMWSREVFSQAQLSSSNDIKPLHFVEIKSVSLAREREALFPDSVTTRGLKHLDELAKLKSRGHTCELVFVVQREDCKSFAPADSIDPIYGQRLREVRKLGVKITALICQLSPDSIQIVSELPTSF